MAMRCTRSTARARPTPRATMVENAALSRTWEPVLPNRYAQYSSVAFPVRPKSSKRHRTVCESERFRDSGRDGTTGDYRQARVLSEVNRCSEEELPVLTRTEFDQRS